MDDSTFQQLKSSRFFHPEVTEVIYDINQLEGMIAGAINVVEKGFDMVWDKMMFNFHYNHLHEGYEAMERLIDEKNLKIRLIVEAIPENIDQINLITNYEIRHLDDIKSNFGILDKRAYVVSIFHKGSPYPQEAFFSNSIAFIDKQQSLFDKMWEIAIPIETRNRQLKLLKEEQDLIKKFHNLNEVQYEVINRIEHCKRELIVFSNKSMLSTVTQFNSFWNMCTSLSKRNIVIKILTVDPSNEILNRVDEINSSLVRDLIQVRNSHSLQNINECIIIMDGESIFRIVNDDACLSQFCGILSTDKNQVLIQEILFEKYWNEIESLTMANPSYEFGR